MLNSVNRLGWILIALVGFLVGTPAVRGGDATVAAYVEQLLRTIVQYGLDHRNPQFAQIRALIEQGIPLPESAARAYLMAARQQAEQLTDAPNRLHRPPTAEQLHVEGPYDITFGHLVEAPEIEIGLRFTEPAMVIAIGSTGSGKTTFLRQLIRAIHEWNLDHPNERISIICFDTKGGDYADAARMFGSDWLHFHVAHSLRLGLNPPAGIPPDAWINLLATNFCSRAGLISAWTTLADEIRWLLEVMNRGNTGDPVWPDFQLLLDLNKASKSTLFSAKGQYAASLTQSLEAITGATGELHRSFGGLDLERDIISQGTHAVIAMPSMYPPWVRQFTKDMLISQLLDGRIHRGERIDRVGVIFVLDESDADLSARGEEAFPDGMSPTSRLLKQGREFGLGAFVGLSTLKGVSMQALANATIHAAFRLRDDASLRIAADTLVLPRGAEDILPTLPPGQALFRQAGTWAHAMLAQVDYLPPCRKSVDVYTKNSFISAKRLDELPSVRTALNELVKQRSARNLSTTSQRRSKTAEHARTLLDLASLYPWEPVGTLWLRAEKSVRPATRKKAQDHLVERKYVRLINTRLSRFNVVLLSILEAAGEELGKRPPQGTGRGEIEHCHFAHWIRMVGEKRGYESELEWRNPHTNHPVDVVWKTDSGYQVFEVLVGNLDPHVKACLEQCQIVDTLTIVAAQMKTLKKVKADIESDITLAPYRDRVRFELVEPFFRELYP